MAERGFILDNFFLGGKAHYGPVITCRKCGIRDYYVRTGGKSSAQKYFQNRGWQLGRGPHMDMCPDCQKPQRKEEKVIKMASKIAPKSANAPRAATREDRRRITEKISEHYLENGYEPPWTDKLIAEALKCPVSWVAEVREFSFGPEGSNEVLDKLLGDARAVLEMKPELDVLKKQFDAMYTMVAEVEAGIRRYERELLGKKVA